MVIRSVFTAFVCALALQRLYELGISRRNERLMRERGGREHAPRHFRLIAVLHGAWLVASVAEVWLLDRAFSPGLALGAGALFALGQWLRASAMHELGWRWSVRIFTVPGSQPVMTGVYRYLRHPNYVGVMLEIAAVPLLHGAWLTAVCFSVLNALLLRVRIEHEEEALSHGSSYGSAFSGTPRFLPRVRDARSSP